MVLTIDVGNSNTVIMVYNEGENTYKKRIITEKNNVIEYYTKMLEMKDEDMDCIVLSCVVPKIFDDIMAVLENNFDTKIIVVRPDTVSSLEILLEDPQTIGADFIATSMGAIDKYDLPVIVADVGSATKLTYTDENGAFLGGTIMPGLGTSIKALHEFIPHLPQTKMALPEKVIGSNTEMAIQSGIIYGLVGQIEGLAKRMEEEQGKQCVKIITGGYASLIKDQLDGFIYDPHLLNDGLYSIYEKECQE